MMPLSSAVAAIRESVAVSVLDHVCILRLDGPDAFDAADRLFTRDLYLRDGQLSQGLLLREDGTIFADVYLAADDEDFFFVAEGPDAQALTAHVERWTGDFDELDIIHEHLAQATIALDGPYAWELMAAFAGPETIGLPYLTFFHLDGRVCYRAGKTGEFGYRLLVPRDEVETTLDALRTAGGHLEPGAADLEALDCCALENWFFNIRREGRAQIGPIELQLQWRVSYLKEFIGSDALRARRSRGIDRRLTVVGAEGPIEEGETLHAPDGEEIGTVVNAVRSPTLEGWIGNALVRLDYAHPHISGLSIGHERVKAGTLRPPLINNRSLYVNPQIHSYATRLDDDFPPL